MGFERYFLHDFFTAQEFNRLEETLALQRSRDRRLHASAEDRLAALEADLGRVALLARALAELCLQKNVVSREELVQLLLTADLADGKADGKLQAKVVMPGESKAADPDPAQTPAAKKAKMKRRRPYP